MNDDRYIDGVIFKRGCCVICDTPISGGFFCPKHEDRSVQQPSQTAGNAVVKNLKVGATAYVNPLSVFSSGGRYFIFSNTKTSNWAWGTNTTKITRRKDHVEVDRSTIADRQISNYQFNDIKNQDFLPAKFNRTTTTKPQIISDMEIDEAGFTEPHNIFELTKALFVVGTGNVSRRRTQYKTVRIIRREDLYEIDGNTITPDDIEYGMPDNADENGCFPAEII